MKKFCMCLFGILFACNAYATTDIPSTATTGDCDESTLGTYSGSVDLEIKWEPNTIPIRWYNGNSSVQSTDDTCDYGDTLTIPNAPSQRNGYNFAGWKVRPNYDFQSLPANESAVAAYGLGANGHNVCYNETSGKAEGPNCRTEVFESGFNGLNKGEWKASFSWGDLYGTSMCSSSSETPVESADGAYCWCKATGYVPSGEDIKYAPTTPLWVYNSSGISVSSGGNICNSVCGGRCALYLTRYNGINAVKTYLRKLLGLQ